MAERTPLNRRCSECGNPLEGNDPRRKTCDAKCRARRSRRMRRLKVDAQNHNALSPHQKDIAEIVNAEARDVAQKVMERELQPIVREALNEEVLQAISELVGLTPTVVRNLKEDLESEDRSLRHRATALLIKYTIGHPAIVRPEDADAGKQLVVNFQMPRPTDAPADDETGNFETEVVEAEELRTCVVCTEEKPAGEFVAHSDRCSQCHQKLLDKAAELLGGPDDA